MHQALSCGSNNINLGSYMFSHFSFFSIVNIYDSCVLIRNRVPFAVILACEFSFGILFLIIRAYLARENRRRDQEQHDQTYDDVYVTLKDEYGNEVQKKIDKVRVFSISQI